MQEPEYPRRDLQRDPEGRAEMRRKTGNSGTTGWAGAREWQGSRDDALGWADSDPVKSTRTSEGRLLV